MALSLAKRLNIEPDLDFSLPRCPFCGSGAEVQFWHGGRPSKRMISCSGNLNECDVRPAVTGETLKEARERWGRRA
jgi:hypothetical protein